MSDSSSQRDAARRAEAAGDFAAAERELSQIVTADPGDGSAVFALAEFLARRGRFAEAEPHYERLRAAFPNEPSLLNSLAVLYSKTGRGSAAVALWQKLQAEHPKLAQPLVNIGLALRAAGDAAAAVEHFQQALARDPNLAEAHFNLGATYLHAKHFEEALDSLAALLRLRPDHARGRILFAQAAQSVCDWDRFETALPQLREEVAKAVAGGPCAVTPWFSLRLPITRAERKAVAAVASQAYEDAARPLARALAFSFAPVAKPCLTVGYISGDFRDHPIGQLTAGLYKRHDRARVRVHAYPVKPADDTFARILRDDADRTVDLSDMSDVEAARQIHADGVDILVDISGFNLFMRPGILALRPAPLQASYLNFAGTLSASLYDYIIADPVVVPPEHAGDYLETVARLPHSYQMNNCDQPVAPPPTRAEEGLPDGAFVFSCFCVGEKIERGVFALWMDMLRDVPGAVLWLFGESPTLQSNLRRAAAALGIDPARLVFAGRRPKAQHLGRVSLADIHFDTGTYGAHTTGSDALWAGVPLVTKEGDSFPSRVGVSLVRAAGLPELAARDWDDYRRICLDLARRPEHLAATKAKLAAGRLTAPLFDTARTVRALESLYAQMWARRVAGQPPQPLDA